jgi:hypothetical protein
MNPDGSGQTLLTNTSGNDLYPAWSPSGTRIAIRSYSDGQADIVLMNADGTGRTKLTDDAAVDSDPDWQPIPINGYARPKGATPLVAALVVAFRPCSSPNEMQGPPLAVDSCNPPVQASDFLTVGTPPQDPAASVGSVRADVILDKPSTPADEADIALRVSITDVRNKADLTDYAEAVQATALSRITDKNNTPSPNGATGAATLQDSPFSFAVPCTPTSDTTIGSVCAVTTTANTLIPGLVRGGFRSIWQLDQVQVYDAGADGQASTSADNTLFMDEGVFVP